MGKYRGGWVGGNPAWTSLKLVVCSVWAVVCFIYDFRRGGQVIKTLWNFRLQKKEAVKVRFGRYDLARWPWRRIDTRPSLSLVLYMSLSCPCSALLYAPTHLHAAKNAHMKEKARAHLDRKLRDARARKKWLDVKKCKIDGNQSRVYFGGSGTWDIKGVFLPFIFPQSEESSTADEFSPQKLLSLFLRLKRFPRFKNLQQLL